MFITLRITTAASILALGSLLASPSFARDARDEISASKQETSAPISEYRQRDQYFRQCADSPARC